MLFWNRVLLSCWDWSQNCNPPVSVSQILGLQVWTTMAGLFFSFYFGLGIEPKGILPLSYTPSPILFFLFWNKVSLSCRGSPKVAEAGRESEILLSQSPKYWDYKRVPPRLDFIYLFILFYFFAVPGIERRGVLPLCYAPGPIFYTLFWNRVSRSCGGPH